MDKNTRTTILIVAGALLAGVVAVGGGIWAFMQISSDARETARAFVLNLSSGEYEEARAVMHPSLRETLSPDETRTMMDGAEAYETVRFNSIEAVNSATTLKGLATTATDCTSQVELQLLSGQVTMFNITPLCPKP